MMNSSRLLKKQLAIAAGIGTAVASLLIGCSPDASVTERLRSAERQVQSESYVNAEIELLNALKQDPRNKTALALMGVISQRQGQWSKAMAFLPRAKLADTNSVEVRRALALTYVNVRLYSRARDEAEFVLTRSPADTDAVFVLVDAARSNAEMESARRFLVKLQQQGGDKAVFQVGLGELSLRQKDMKTAATHLARALNLDGRSTMAHAAMASVYFAQGDQTNATRSLQMAAELAPIRSFIRMKWADYLVEISRVDEARQFLEQNVRDAPGYVPALTRLAQIAFDQRKYDECATVLRRALTAEPLGFDGLLLNSKTQLARNDAKKAVQGFERMASLYPQAPAVHFQLGLAHLVGGNLARGLASLNQAVTLEPGYAEAVLLLADLQLRSGDAFSAISSISGLLKKRPDLLPAHLALAEAYRVRGTPDDAVTVYRRMMDLYPKDPQPPFLMGVTLRQQKKHDEARNAFDGALAVETAFLRAVIQLV
jgi:Tfp pilus assembly protein PilF